MNTVKQFLIEGYDKRAIILSLARRNFQQQYFGSALGFFWAFIEPLIYTGILYAVFTIGLRVGSVSSMPFAVYLITGITAWLYFANTLNGSSLALPRLMIAIMEQYQQEDGTIALPAVLQKAMNNL